MHSTLSSCGERGGIITPVLKMLRLAVLTVVFFAVSVIGQNPKQCISPMQFHSRISQYDHANDIINRYVYIYDNVLKREVFFEEMNSFMPGQRFYQIMIFDQERIQYNLDLRSRECTKTVPRPWREFEIPGNATFENEFVLGGPGESFTVQEWSDRIEFRRNAMNYIQFSLINCYPIKSIVISDNNVTNSVTTDLYDFVEGIPNPNDFIIPKECLTARWSEKNPLTLWR